MTKGKRIASGHCRFCEKEAYLVDTTLDGDFPVPDQWPAGWRFFVAHEAPACDRYKQAIRKGYPAVRGAFIN